MTSSDVWDAEKAERYDETSAFMFEPEVLLSRWGNGVTTLSLMLG